MRIISRLKEEKLKRRILREHEWRHAYGYQRANVAHIVAALATQVLQHSKLPIDHMVSVAERAIADSQAVEWYSNPTSRMAQRIEFFANMRGLSQPVVFQGGKCLSHRFRICKEEGLWLIRYPENKYTVVCKTWKAALSHMQREWSL